MGEWLADRAGGMTASCEVERAGERQTGQGRRQGKHKASAWVQLGDLMLPAAVPSAHYRQRSAAARRRRSPESFAVLLQV
jgi:hypothetical protein